MNRAQVRRIYRVIKIMHLVLVFAVLGVAYCLARGWPFGVDAIFWGVPLRNWGYALAASALIHGLWSLTSELRRPGRKPTWFG